ncbi:pyridoxal phosphate-dependent decarboxylase family protein [Hyalangium versicolor]|uniref:pyridoxal phosphate-dependent decarboxylase family protein n=1 Tax=Hyalangium versicolor TaxID=2861190 RepID=UPI001CCDEFC2|nr:pyridoxal-dependent decarboxylase [Hyalangium versicolor]
MARDKDEATGTNPQEFTLDPRDWEAFRALGHRMLDDMVDHLSTLRQQPAWKQIPERTRHELVNEPLPRLPQGEERAYEDFRRNVLPYPNGNLHPRFFGWVQGNGIPLAMLADMLASGMNPHLAGFNQAPALVEQKVISWLATLMGFPENASGVLESGGTMANVLGLAVARHAKSGVDMRKQGLQGGGPHLTVYCSTETHGWAQKAVELLGLGTDWLRRIPVDREFRMDVSALKEAVTADRAAGHRPLCVIGSAGTVNTGSVDDLQALADFCQAQELWFHVDGAFGALARLSPKLAPLVLGLERADSVAFDLHKWMYLPFEIACLLVRHPEAHTGTFAISPSYLAKQTRGVSAGGVPFSDRGVDLTRAFKALKAWMCLKAYGVELFARLIEQNFEQTRYLVRKIEDHPNLELLAPAPLNVACFRYRAEGLSAEKLDSLNTEILLRVQERGLAVPSSTVVNGVFAIRACNVNHRATRQDVDELVQAVIDMGETVLREESAPPFDDTMGWII